MSGASVFVVGSLHLDVVVNSPHLPSLDETVTGTGVAYVCGGKGGNQAVAAALHQAPTAMAGRVGDDMFAERLLKHLDEAGVECSALQVGRGSPSGMSVAIVDQNGDYGAVIVSAANLDLDQEAIEIPESARVVVLQNEIPEAVNIDVAHKAQAAGALVVLNAAPWRTTSNELLACVNLLVLNRVEAYGMTGQEIRSLEEAAEAARSLVTPSRAVIITLGADDVLYCDKMGNTHAQPAFEVEVISTHGAGDMFIGALASRIAAGDDTREAISYAAAAAALHVSTPVSQRLSMGPAEVRALMNKAESSCFLQDSTNDKRR